MLRHLLIKKSENVFVYRKVFGIFTSYYDKGAERQEEFGTKRIDLVKTSDAKKWLKKLQEKDGRSYSSIHSVRGVVRPLFRWQLRTIY